MNFTQIFTTFIRLPTFYRLHLYLSTIFYLQYLLFLCAKKFDLTLYNIVIPRNLNGLRFNLQNTRNAIERR